MHQNNSNTICLFIILAKRNFYSVVLPPANKVWCKVMFLYLDVILFTGLGIDLASLHASEAT